jgi:acyl-CoA thioesterase
MSIQDALQRAQESARQMLEDDVATRRLGIEISDVAPGRATARMSLAQDMLNGHGIGHGGYVFLLADTAFAFACNTYGAPTVARGCDISYLRPTHAGDVLHATAREVVRAGRSGIYDVTVRTDDGGIVAEFRGHSAVMSAREPA